MSQKRFEYISTLFWKRVNKNSLTWWYVLETSWRDLCKTSWRRLEDAFETSWISLEDILKTSWRCLEDVFARCLEDVLKTFWRRLGKTSWKRVEDVLKTYDQDDYLVIIKTSWRLKTSWRRLLKTYELGEYFLLDQDVLKTSSEEEDERRLQYVLKTSPSRRMFAGLDYTTNE